VEEQFYLTFPLLMLCAYGNHAVASSRASSHASPPRSPRKSRDDAGPSSSASASRAFSARPLLVLLPLSAISLLCCAALCYAALSPTLPLWPYRDLVFYLTPFRFWELAIGALLLHARARSSERVHRLLSARATTAQTRRPQHLEYMDMAHCMPRTSRTCTLCCVGTYPCTVCAHTHSHRLLMVQARATLHTLDVLSALLLGLAFAYSDPLYFPLPHGLLAVAATLCYLIAGAYARPEIAAYRAASRCAVGRTPASAAPAPDGRTSSKPSTSAASSTTSSGHGTSAARVAGGGSWSWRLEVCHAPLFNRLLSLPIVVWVGKISYPLCNAHGRPERNPRLCTFLCCDPRSDTSSLQPPLL
jgi:peptidoglycan/LPS O-acetylase OafA/YrhL